MSWHRCQTCRGRAVDLLLLLFVGTVRYSLPSVNSTSLQTPEAREMVDLKDRGENFVPLRKASLGLSPKCLSVEAESAT